MFAFLQKNGSFAFLYIIAFLFTVVIAYQMVNNVVPNSLAVGIVNIVIGYAINSQGVSHGVAVTNDTVNKTAIAQYPLTPAGKLASEAQVASDLVQSTATAHPPQA